MACWDKLQGLG